MAVKHTTEYKIIEEINKTKQNETKEKNKSENKIVEKLQKYCTQLVTVHGRPLAMIEDEAFQKIINLVLPSNADVKQINQKSIKEHVCETAYKMKHKLQEEIKHQMISLKIDSATCTERKFIGINIQYIKNSEIVVRNLAVVEVIQSQTGMFLKSKLEEVLMEFNISIDQIYCICTDNGANMIKMVKLIGGKYFIEDNGQNEQENGSDEEDNLLDEEGNVSSGNDNEDTEIVEIGSERRENFEIRREENEEIIIQNRDHNIFFTDFQVEDIITCGDFQIRGMLCAAHTLQLAIKDAISADTPVQTTINLARRIVNILRKPNNYYTFKSMKLRKPIIDCKTRWTSTFNMLQRLITLKDICSIIHEIDLVVSENFWTEITTITKILEPVNAATISLQKQNLTIGDFYITWTSCRNKIQAINHPFAKNLHHAMQEREKKLLQNDIVLEGIFLDRRLNLILNIDQCNKAKSLLRESYQQLQKIRQGTFVSAETQSAETNVPNNFVQPSTSSAALSSLEEILLTAERLRGSHRQLSSFEAFLYEIISAPRLSLQENIISHWNCRSVISSDISMLANTILAAPATQVSVERLFSSLKFILNPLRSNLSNVFLKDLMFVRENKDLLD